MVFDRRLLTYLQLAALAVAIGVAGYLAYLKYTNGIPPCTIGGGCAAAPGQTPALRTCAAGPGR